MNKDQEIYSHYQFSYLQPFIHFDYVQHSTIVLVHNNAMQCQMHLPFKNSCDFHIFHIYFSFSLEVNEFVLLSIKPKNTNAMK